MGELKKQAIIKVESFLLQFEKNYAIGVIESNGQIVRNESGKYKHKEFTGVYEPKPLKTAAEKQKSPATYGKIPAEKDTYSSKIFQTIILWVIIVLVLLVIMKYWPV
jgi:hypothetical protein